MEFEFINVMDALGMLTMELSTDDVETFKDVPADSWFQLAGKINGNIGMYFGFSVFHLAYARSVVKWSYKYEYLVLYIFLSDTQS